VTSKALDCINHKIFINKLNHYGVPGENKKWFELYLTGRTQRVDKTSLIYQQNVSSVLKEIKFGVPQGSILGPLLFVSMTCLII
jgi:hypothetical protein